MAAKCTLHVSYPCVKCPCVMSMCPWVFLTRAVCVRGQTVNLPSDIRVSIYSAITSVLSRYIIQKSISTRKRVGDVKLGFERSDIGKKW